MSRILFAVLLSLYTCLGWGLIAPSAVKMGQTLGEKFHPAHPFFWTTLGHMFVSLIILIVTRFEPLKAWSWTGMGGAFFSGWTIFFFWPTASLAIAYAYSYATGREWLPNTISAVYPALVSLPILLYIFGQKLSIGQAAGVIVTIIGVLMTRLL